MKNDEEKIEQLDETMDFNNPSYSFKPQGRHSYRQEGPYLVCHSCEIRHATWVGMETIMVGEDSEGNPILKKR
jgi:hypothetical protein